MLGFSAIAETALAEIPPLGVPVFVQQNQDLLKSFNRSTRAAAIFRGSDGTEANYSFFVNYGHFIQQWQPPHRPQNRAGAVMRGDDGTQSRFVTWKNAGWEVQSVQPPHRGVEKKGSFLRGDDGTEAKLVNWRNAGWEVQSPPTYQIISKRGGAISRIDDGTQNTFSAFQAFWETQQTVIKPARKVAGALKVDPEFAVLPQFQPWLEYTNSQEKFLKTKLAVVNNDFIVPLTQRSQVWGFDPGPTHISRNRRKQTATGDDGVYAKLITVRAWGWEIEQRVYTRPFRKQVVTNESMLLPLTVVPPFTDFGWDVAAPMLIRPPRRIVLPAPEFFVFVPIYSGLIIEAAHAADFVSALLIPGVPCPCEPVSGPGSGNNPSIAGPGAGANPSISGPGSGTNPSIVGPGACKC